MMWIFEENLRENFREKTKQSCEKILQYIDQEYFE